MPLWMNLGIGALLRHLTLGSPHWTQLSSQITSSNTGRIDLEEFPSVRRRGELDNIIPVVSQNFRYPFFEANSLRSEALSQYLLQRRVHKLEEFLNIYCSPGVVAMPGWYCLLGSFKKPRLLGENINKFHLHVTNVPHGYEYT